jgi:hypothetical protein
MPVGTSEYIANNDRRPGEIPAGYRLRERLIEGDGDALNGHVNNDSATADHFHMEIMSSKNAVRECAR